MNVENFLKYLEDIFGENELHYPADMADAIIGYVERIGMSPLILLDKKKCIDILVEKGNSVEEAIDFFEYNIMGAYIGEGTPCFATLMKDL